MSAYANLINFQPSRCGYGSRISVLLVLARTAFTYCMKLLGKMSGKFNYLPRSDEYHRFVMMFERLAIIYKVVRLGSNKDTPISYKFFIISPREQIQLA